MENADMDPEFRIFSPLFGRPDIEHEDYEAPVHPSPWDDLDASSDILQISIEHFLPYLSRRTQRIFGQLGVKTVGDVTQLTKEQVFSCERGTELVLCEIRETILDPKHLPNNFE